MVHSTQHKFSLPSFTLNFVMLLLRIIIIIIIKDAYISKSRNLVQSNQYVLGLWVFKRCPFYLSINQRAVDPPSPLPTRHFGAHLGLILSFSDKIKFIFPPYLGKAQFDGALFTKGPSLISGSLNLQLTMRHLSSAGGGLALTELSICFDLNVFSPIDNEAKETTPHSLVPLQLTRRPQSSTGVSEGFPRAVILRVFALIIQFIVI